MRSQHFELHVVVNRRPAALNSAAQNKKDGGDEVPTGALTTEDAVYRLALGSDLLLEYFAMRMSRCFRSCRISIIFQSLVHEDLLDITDLA